MTTMPASRSIAVPPVRNASLTGDCAISPSFSRRRNSGVSSMRTRR
ncbi:hypothetical protein HFP72_01660 [Nocardiopsis sp. ARC36]